MLEKKGGVVAREISGHSHEELKLIVGYLTSMSKYVPKDIDYTWIFLLELFQGMRVGEVCGLSSKEIINVDDVPCIAINTGRGKFFKNMSCIRTIPIHEVLLNLDFLGYVNSRTDKLFTTMSQRTYLARKRRLHKKILIPAKDLRITFATALSGISTPCIAARILGHSIPSTSEVYRKPDMSVLSRELNFVGYGFNIFKTLGIKPVSDEIIAKQVKLLPQKEEI